MLVEEPRVEVEDAFADDVEAEVAGLDHAGVDRADGDLVASSPWTGTVQPRAVVVDERAQRLVAVEHAVESWGLALVPAGGRHEVDDRRRVTVGVLSATSRVVAACVDEQRAHVRPPALASARRTPAVGQRLLHGAAPPDSVDVGPAAHRSPA